MQKTGKNRYQKVVFFVNHNLPTYQRSVEFVSILTYLQDEV